VAGGVGGQSVAGARLDAVCVSSCRIVLVCVSVYPVRTECVLSHACGGQDLHRVRIHVAGGVAVQGGGKGANVTLMVICSLHAGQAEIRLLVLRQPQQASAAAPYRSHHHCCRRRLLVG